MTASAPHLLQGRLLKILGGIIVICLIILAIDKFMVRKHQPSKNDKLQQIVDAYSLSIATPAQEKQLEAILKRLGQGKEMIKSVSSVVLRSDAAHSLWLFEYEKRATALKRENQSDAMIDVTLFGIVFELVDALKLPVWSQEKTPGPPMPPFTPENVAQLMRLGEYRLSTTENLIFMTTTLEGSALIQQMATTSSDEFYAGLFNSAMKVDLQSAVNLVNAMDTGNPPIPAFYKIDIIAPNIPMRETGIASRLEQIRIDTMQEYEEKKKANNEKFEAIRKQQKEQTEANLEKLRSGSKLPLKAEEHASPLN